MGVVAVVMNCLVFPMGGSLSACLLSLLNGSLLVGLLTVLCSCLNPSCLVPSISFLGTRLINGGGLLAVGAMGMGAGLGSLGSLYAGL